MQNSPNTNPIHLRSNELSFLSYTTVYILLREPLATSSEILNSFFYNLITLIPAYPLKEVDLNLTQRINDQAKLTIKIPVLQILQHFHNFYVQT